MCFARKELTIVEMGAGVCKSIDVQASLGPGGGDYGRSEPSLLTSSTSTSSRLNWRAFHSKVSKSASTGALLSPGGDHHHSNQSSSTKKSRDSAKGKHSSKSRDTISDHHQANSRSRPTSTKPNREATKKKTCSIEEDVDDEEGGVNHDDGPRFPTTPWPSNSRSKHSRHSRQKIRPEDEDLNCSTCELKQEVLEVTLEDVRKRPVSPIDPRLLSKMPEQEIIPDEADDFGAEDEPKNEKPKEEDDDDDELPFEPPMLPIDSRPISPIDPTSVADEGPDELFPDQEDAEKKNRENENEEEEGEDETPIGPPLLPVDSRPISPIDPRFIENPLTNQEEEEEEEMEEYIIQRPFIVRTITSSNRSTMGDSPPPSPEDSPGRISHAKATMTEGKWGKSTSLANQKYYGYLMTERKKPGFIPPKG